MNIFSKLSLRQKFLLGMGIALLPAISVSIIGLITMNTVISTLDRVRSDLGKAYIPTEQAQTLLAETHTSLTRALRNGSGVGQEQYKMLIRALDIAFAQIFENGSFNEGELTQIRAAQKAWLSAHLISEELLLGLTNEQDNAIVDEKISLFDDYISESSHELKDVTSLSRQQIDTQLDRVHFLGLQATMIIFILLLLPIAAIGILGTIFINSILRPIQILTEGARRIGEGNLHLRVKLGRTDELGELANSFNTMSEHIKHGRDAISSAQTQIGREKIELEGSNKDLADAKAAILNILEDVEASRRHVEEEKSKVEAILSNLGEGVYVVDADDRIVLFNKTALQQLGYDMHEVLGRNERDIFDMLDEKGNKVLQGGFPPTYWFWKRGVVQTISNLTFARKSNDRFPVSIAVAPIRTGEGGVLGGVVAFRDVTKEREIDRMKSEFVSVASHQLRTPLSAIKWFLEMVLGGDAGKLNTQQHDFLDRAYSSNERMIHLVNDLLNVSRIESGRLHIEKHSIDIRQIIESVASELSPFSRARNVQIIIQAETKVLPMVYGDAQKIREIVSNLISNAVKYTMAHGTVTISMRIDGKMMRIDVKDTGLGIPASQHAKVFAKFFRADNVLRIQTEGSGLGLYIVKALVEASGGTVSFVSEENKGTTFTFTLPLAPPSAESDKVVT